MIPAKKILSTTGEPMLSARAAAERLGCAPDYVGKLCREGKLEGTRVNSAWFVGEASLMRFEEERTGARIVRARELAELRRRENEAYRKAHLPVVRRAAKLAIKSAGVLVALVLLAGSLALASGGAQRALGGVGAKPLLASSLQSPFFETAPASLPALALDAPVHFAARFVSNFFSLFKKEKPKYADTASVDLVAQPSKEAPARAGTPDSSAPAAPATIVQNTYPVIERTVEHTLAVSGVSEDELTARLDELSNALKSQIATIANPGYGSPLGNFAIGQHIDTLTNVVIRDATGLTDADIPDDITASNYLPLLGGTVSGSLSVGTTSAAKLTVSGSGYFTEGLGVGVLNTGAGTLETSGNATVGGALAVTGSGTSTFSGALAVDADGLVYDKAAHAVGVGTTTPAATFAVAGNSYISGGLGVGVATSAPGVLETSGNAIIGGNLQVTGNSVTLGNSSANTLTIKSAITSSIVPNKNITYDLGSPSFFWNNAYVGTLTANSISAASTTIGGTQSNTFTLNSDNASADAQDSSLIFFRGSVVPNALLTWNSTAKRFDFNQPLHVQNADTSNLGGTTLALAGLAGQTGNLLSVASSSGASYLTVTGGGKVGVGTASPYAALAISGPDTANGTAAFQVSNSASSTAFVVTDAGKVGVGYEPSSVPFIGAALSVNGDIAQPNGSLIHNTGIQYIANGADNIKFGTFTNGVQAAMTFNAFSGTPFIFNTQNSASRVGIGTTSPWANLSVDTTGLGAAPAFAVGSSTETSLAVLNSGRVVVNTTKDLDNRFALQVHGLGEGWGIYTDGVIEAGNSVISQNALSAPVVSYNANGNINMSFNGANGSPKFGIGFNTLSGGDINLQGSTGSNVGISTSTPLAHLDIFNTLGETNDLFNISTTTSTNVFKSLFKVTASGNVGVGTTTPYAKLSINANVEDTDKTLFAISSSTSSGTATLLSLDNTGKLFVSGGSTEPVLAIGQANKGLGSPGIDQLGFYVGGVSEFYLNRGGNSIFSTNLASIQGTDGSAAAPFFTFNTDTNTGLFHPGADQLGLSTGGTERLHIDSSGNVGIGTTTPQYPLTVNGAIFAGINGSANAPAISFGDGQKRGFYYGPGDGSIHIVSGGYELANFNPTADRFYSELGPGSTNGYDLGDPSFEWRNLYLGSNALIGGKVGIGTTTPQYPLTVAGAVSIYGTSTPVTKKGFLSLYVATDTANTTTAAGYITGSKLYDSRLYLGDAANPLFAVNFSHVANGIEGLPSIAISGTDTSGDGFCFTDCSIGMQRSGNALVFKDNYPGDSTDYVGFNVASAERLRITNTGNVGIGTTTPQYPLTVNGAIFASDLGSLGAPAISFGDGQQRGFYSPANGSIHIVSGGSELASFQGNAIRMYTELGPQNNNAYDLGDSSFEWRNIYLSNSAFIGGKTGIGTTSPTYKLDVSDSQPSAFVARFSNTANTSGPAGIWISSGINGTASGAAFIQFTEPNGTGAGSITQSTGGTSVAYNTTSDRRLKENIATTTAGLADLLKIPVDDFNFISDSDKVRVQGFIAQDLERVYPEAVTTNGDDGTTPLGATSTPWQVDYGRITPLIVKAVQDIATLSDTFKNTLIAWLGDAGNGIHDLYATVFHAQEVDTQKLCVGSVCVTPAQFQAMVAAYNAGGTSTSSATTTATSTTAIATTTDTTPPTITIIGNNPATISVGSTYSDLGATVSDNVSSNLGYRTFVDSVLMSPVSIDTSVAGTHTVDYVATDQAGNTATSTRTVIVQAVGSGSAGAAGTTTTSTATTTATSTTP